MFSRERPQPEVLPAMWGSRYRVPLLRQVLFVRMERRDMSPEDHYAAAERLLAAAGGHYNNPRFGSERRDEARFMVAQAAVHAALAAAPARMNASSEEEK